MKTVNESSFASGIPFGIIEILEAILICNGIHMFNLHDGADHANISEIDKLVCENPQFAVSTEYIYIYIYI